VPLIPIVVVVFFVVTAEDEVSSSTSYNNLSLYIDFSSINFNSVLLEAADNCFNIWSSMFKTFLKIKNIP